MKSPRGRLAVIVLAACSSPTTPASVDGGVPGDASHQGGPASSGDASNGGGNNVGDGAPVREPCTTHFGNALTTTFGRLDGILVAIVPPGGGCTADSDHVHLQIRANGAVYDVAVNVRPNTPGDEVRTTTRDIALPGGLAWSEGWHTGVSDDYPALGVHAADLTATTEAQLTADLMADLATVNHITLFATGYGPTGAHLVHRNGSGHDGLIVTQPLSTPPHLRLFAFSSQSF